MKKILYMKLELIKNTLISFLLIFFFLNSPSVADYINIKSKKSCEKNSEKFFDNLKYIEIKVIKNRKFIKKITTAVLNNVIGEKKKLYNSQIILHYENGDNCVFDSKIRIQGDFADHVDIIDGNPISSFHVNLNKSNIANLTSFKIFLPKTRNYLNEIFATNFFRNIGILAPRTKLIKVKFNNKIHNMLIQEHIAKEFLEFNNLTESLIFEGHDKNLFNRLGGNAKISRLTKLSNSKIVLKDEDIMREAIVAMSKINKIYLNNNLLKNKLNINNEMLIFDNQIDSINKYYFQNKNKIFENFMNALGGNHGLSQEDRVFYYDPHYKNFLPIYYDGGTSLFHPNEKDPPNQFFDIENEKAFRISNKFFLDTVSLEENEDIYLACIQLVSNINKNEFIKELNDLGMKINKFQIDRAFTEITKRLKKINENKKSKVIDKNIDFNYKPYFSLFNYRYPTKISFLEYPSTQVLCPAQDSDAMQCQKFALKTDLKNNKKFKKTLAQNFYDNDEEVIFVSNDYKKYYQQNEIYQKKEALKIETFKIFSLNNGKIEVDNINKKIKLKSNNVDQRFLVYDGDINNWSFEYIENHDVSGLLRSDMLTGCVTFIDIGVHKLNLTSNKSSCEDAFNFIRTKGSVNKIQISNALSDALDADFSNIIFKNITINKTTNDCVDFSYGKYTIEEVNLEKCGDKAISVGEKSNLKLNYVSINSATTGIAVKDSSYVYIDNFHSNESSNCISVYQKKDEFNGAQLNINNFKCTNFINEIIHDNKSSITITNKLE